MPSPVNQRIESYWSKFVCTWLVEIIFFQDMVDLEVFDPSEPTLLDCVSCAKIVQRHKLFLS